MDKAMDLGRDGEGPFGPGKGWTEYEVGDFVFQVSHPELTYREEGDSVICKFESLTRTLYRPKAPPSSEGSPSPVSPNLPHEKGPIHEG